MSLHCLNGQSICECSAAIIEVYNPATRCGPADVETDVAPAGLQAHTVISDPP